MSAHPCSSSNAVRRFARLAAGCGLVASVGIAASADSDAAAAVAVKPIPALMTAHAEKGLLLSVANAGEHLVAVGGNGDIVVSDDGLHWTQVQTPVDVTLTGVAFADDRHGWAVGHDALILHTADGGHSWTLQNSQPELNAPMFAVLALDQQKALAVGAFGTLKLTEDGGAHWSDVDAPDVVKDKLHLNAVTRLANGELFVAGEHGLAAVSPDGHQWRRLAPPYEGSFFGVLPWGARGAIAFGLRGNVFATDDVASDHWHKIETRTTSSFFGGMVAADDRVVLVGGDGQIVELAHSGAMRLLVDNTQWKGQASSFAGSALFGGGLFVVGEPGVVRVSLKQDR